MLFKPHLTFVHSTFIDFDMFHDLYPRVLFEIWVKVSKRWLNISIILKWWKFVSLIKFLCYFGGIQRIVSFCIADRFTNNYINSLFTLILFFPQQVPHNWTNIICSCNIMELSKFKRPNLNSLNVNFQRLPDMIQNFFYIHSSINISFILLTHNKIDRYS